MEYHGIRVGSMCEKIDEESATSTVVLVFK